MNSHSIPAPVPTAPHAIYGTYHYVQVKEVADAMNVAPPSVRSDDEPIPTDVLVREAISKKSLVKFKDLLSQLGTNNTIQFDSLLKMAFLYAGQKGNVDVVKYLVEERNINVNLVDEEMEV